MKKSEPSIKETRFGRALYASAVLKDETGEIKLNLWRSQATSVKVGDVVSIECGFVKSFSGQKELSVGAKGVIRRL